MENKKKKRKENKKRDGKKITKPRQIDRWELRVTDPQNPALALFCLKESQCDVETLSVVEGAIRNVIN